MNLTIRPFLLIQSKTLSKPNNNPPPLLKRKRINRNPTNRQIKHPGSSDCAFCRNKVPAGWSEHVGTRFLFDGINFNRIKARQNGINRCTSIETAAWLSELDHSWTWNRDAEENNDVFFCSFCNELNLLIGMLALFLECCGRSCAQSFTGWADDFLGFWGACCAGRGGFQKDNCEK